MDGAGLQSIIDRGYGIAAQRIGFPCSVYRPASMLNPVGGTPLYTNVMAGFTTGSEYSRYNKPKVPDWTALLDGTNIQIGDWFVGAQGTFYIADMQKILPIAAIRCNRTVSIVRPGYSAVSATPVAETTIASSFPVFGFTSTRGRSLSGIPVQTQSDSGIHGMVFYLNNHSVGGIRIEDVIVDENGDRFVIDSAALTSFGYIVETHTFLSSAQAILRMLNDNGRSVTLRSYTLGTYAPSTNTVTGGSTADTTRRAVVIDYDSLALGTEFLPGTVIMTGDKKCYLDATAAINVQDHIIIDSVEFNIVNLKVLNYGGATTSAYELLLRR